MFAEIRIHGGRDDCIASTLATAIVFKCPAKDHFAIHSARRKKSKLSPTLLSQIPSIDKLEKWLSDAEQSAGDVTEGTDKLIVWSKKGRACKTAVSVVYIHGFSATRQETAPVSDGVAAKLDANLFYTRLRGHGLDGDSLGAATEQQWLDDTLEALEIAQRLGEQVIAIGASTGATLLAWLAAERRLPASVTGLVFISPNFGPVDRRTEIFNRRFGLRIAKKLVGPRYRWEPRNADHEKYWTCDFPLEALATMMKCVAASRNSIATNKINCPVLTLYSPDDKTVSANRTIAVSKHYINPLSRMIEVKRVEDVNQHILAGDIMSPSTTVRVSDHITDFVYEVQQDLSMIYSKRSQPVVAVMGAADINAVPGLSACSEMAQFRFADSAAELKQVLPGADVVFGWDFREASLNTAWADADQLRWIQWPGAGVDAVLFPALVDSDVVLTNVRGVFDRAMAEFALGQILMFCKEFPQTLADQDKKHWNHRFTEVIHDRSVLVVGVGSIGREIARLLQAVGMKVSGVGRSARSGDADFEQIEAVSELNAILPTADFVIAVTPLTQETKGLFGASQFNAMSRHARFINLGRGALVDEEALVKALHNGDIGGAALDVFNTEPLPTASPLWDAPDCIVSPHMSGDFIGHQEAVTAIFTQNLRRYIAGKPLHNVVDKKAGFVSGQS